MHEIETPLQNLMFIEMVVFVWVKNPIRLYLMVLNQLHECKNVFVTELERGMTSGWNSKSNSTFYGFNCERGKIHAVNEVKKTGQLIIKYTMKKHYFFNYYYLV